MAKILIIDDEKALRDRPEDLEQLTQQYAWVKERDGDKSPSLQ